MFSNFFRKQSKENHEQRDYDFIFCAAIECSLDILVLNRAIDSVSQVWNSVVDFISLIYYLVFFLIIVETT